MQEGVPPEPLPQSASTGVEVSGSDSGVLEEMEKSVAKRSIGVYLIERRRWDVVGCD
jgi:hypothetical protein